MDELRLDQKLQRLAHVAQKLAHYGIAGAAMVSLGAKVPAAWKGASDIDLALDSVLVAAAHLNLTTDAELPDLLAD